MIHYNIDHIVIDRRRHSSIIDVQIFRETNYDTNHYLADAEVRERLAVSKQKAENLIGTDLISGS
jgi:hypothetical protein